jgi:hypothetical protein
MNAPSATGCRISILRLFEPKIDFGAADSCRRGSTVKNNNVKRFLKKKVKKYDCCKNKNNRKNIIYFSLYPQKYAKEIIHRFILSFLPSGY